MTEAVLRRIEDDLRWPQERPDMAEPGMIVQRMTQDLIGFAREGGDGSLLALGWSPEVVARFYPAAREAADIAASLDGIRLNGAPALDSPLNHIEAAGAVFVPDDLFEMHLRRIDADSASLRRELRALAIGVAGGSVVAFILVWAFDAWRALP